MMSQDLDQKTRGRKSKGTIHYPELEFVTAVYNLNLWADKIERKTGSPERLKQLLSKCEALEDVMGKGIAIGKQSDVADEIVRDEYVFSAKALSVLFNKIHDEKIRYNAKKLIRRSGIGFNLTLENKQLWLVRPVSMSANEDDNECLVAAIWNREIGKTEFVRSVVGSLFDITAETVKEKIKKADTKNRDTRSVSAMQQFLVDLFIIGGAWNGAKQSLFSVKQLLEIVRSLYNSGYHALKLYHLVKMVSNMELGINVHLDWETVECVIEALSQTKMPNDTKEYQLFLGQNAGQWEKVS